MKPLVVGGQGKSNAAAAGAEWALWVVGGLCAAFGALVVVLQAFGAIR